MLKNKEPYKFIEDINVKVEDTVPWKYQLAATNPTIMIIKSIRNVDKQEEVFLNELSKTV
jgi:hypothetical protein